MLEYNYRCDVCTGLPEDGLYYEGGRDSSRAAVHLYDNHNVGEQRDGGNTGTVKAPEYIQVFMWDICYVLIVEQLCPHFTGW